MIKINGNLIHLFKKWILDNYGIEVFEKTVEKVDPDVNNVLTSPILSSQYYDLKIYQQFLEAFEKVTSHEDMLRSAKFQVDRQLGGLFGFIVRFLSMGIVINNLGRMWKKEFTGGKIECLEKRDGFYKIKVSGIKLNDAHRTHFEHYMKYACEIVTKKNWKAVSKLVDGEYIYEVSRL